MHSLFSLTAYDFSAAIGGFMPLFALGLEPGSAHAFVGWATGPARLLLVAALLGAFLHRGAVAAADGSATPSLPMLRRWRIICQAFWFAGCLPLMVHLIRLRYDAGRPCFVGTVLLGAGTRARADAHAWLFAALGGAGGAAVTFASFLGFLLCLHNGLGPYVGIKTSGSITCLYSNAIFESEASNHYLRALFRRCGLPLRVMTDVVMVTESSHPSIARQVHCERIARLAVFGGIVDRNPSWRRAGRITTPGKFPGSDPPPACRDRDPCLRSGAGD